MQKELKIRVHNLAATEQRLLDRGATFTGEDTYRYAYFNQPAGHVLKITQTSSTTHETRLQLKKNQFEITSTLDVDDLERRIAELSAQFGLKARLSNLRRFFTLGDYSISTNQIENVGVILIAESEDPSLAYISELLELSNPEVITESFDNL